MIGRPHWNHQAATFGQLFYERRRHGRCRGGNQDRVKGGCWSEPLRAVTDLDADTWIAESGQKLACGRRQRRNGFECDHFACQQRKHSGLVAGSGPDIENALVAFKRQGVCAGGNDVGLRDRLAFPSGQRLVGVRLCYQTWKNKQMAWNGLHRGEDARRTNPPFANLPSNHIAPSFFKLRVIAGDEMAVTVHVCRN